MPPSKILGGKKMQILESEIEGYEKLRKEAERILTECQNITDFPRFYKTIGINLGKDYSDIYVAYEEFKISVLMGEKISEKNYIFQVGVLDGRISTRMKSIQTAASNDLAFKSKVEEFMIAKNAVVKYLLSIMD